MIALTYNSIKPYVLEEIQKESKKTKDEYN